MTITTLIFDTETTGLPAFSDRVPLENQPYVVEFAALKIRPDGIKTIYNSLINPGVQIPENVIKIHGITNDSVANSPDFEAFLPTLVDAFSDVDLVIAHNIQFDRQMLNIELKRAGCNWIHTPAHWFCTAEAFRDATNKRMKLIELYQHAFGVPLNQTHRALDDVSALAEIVDHFKIIESMSRIINK